MKIMGSLSARTAMMIMSVFFPRENSRMNLKAIFITIVVPLLAPCRYSRLVLVEIVKTPTDDRRRSEGSPMQWL